MKKHLLTSLFGGAFLVALSTVGHAQLSGNTTVVLNITPYTDLQVNTSTLTFEPTADEIRLGSIERTGANGISLSVRTNNSAGATLAVRGDGTRGGSALSSNDIQFKSSTTGSLVTAYTTLTDTNQDFWATNSAKTEFTDAPNPIQVDIKLNNLKSYVADDTQGPITGYSNTLTFTVTPNASSLPEGPLT